MTVTKVVTVVKTKKGPHTHKKKGELMENDQDAMEVSIFLPSSWFPGGVCKYLKGSCCF